MFVLATSAKTFECWILLIVTDSSSKIAVHVKKKNPFHPNYICYQHNKFCKHKTSANFYIAYVKLGRMSCKKRKNNTQGLLNERRDLETLNSDISVHNKKKEVYVKLQTPNLVELIMLSFIFLNVTPLVLLQQNNRACRMQTGVYIMRRQEPLSVSSVMSIYENSPWRWIMVLMPVMTKDNITTNGHNRSKGQRVCS